MHDDGIRVFSYAARLWIFFPATSLKNGAPKGNRTPVFAVRGRRPRPLDDGSVKRKRSSYPQPHPAASDSGHGLSAVHMPVDSYAGAISAAAAAATAPASTAGCGRVPTGRCPPAHGSLPGGSPPGNRRSCPWRAARGRCAEPSPPARRNGARARLDRWDAHETDHIEAGFLPAFGDDRRPYPAAAPRPFAARPGVNLDEDRQAAAHPRAISCASA